MWYAVLVSTTLEPCRGMGDVIVLAHVTGVREEDCEQILHLTNVRRSK